MFRRIMHRGNQYVALEDLLEALQVSEDRYRVWGHPTEAEATRALAEGLKTLTGS
jgi:hypothetical protein